MRFGRQDGRGAVKAAKKSRREILTCGLLELWSGHRCDLSQALYNLNVVMILRLSKILVWF